MAFVDMDRADRLSRLGVFLAETKQFVEGKKVINRSYRGYRLGSEGTCVFITGLSGTGKTTLADDVIEDLRVEWDAMPDTGIEKIIEMKRFMPPTWGISKIGEKGMIRPVVKVYVGPKVRFKELLRDTLYALGIRAPRTTDFGELMTLVVMHLDQQKVRLLIFDEVHHIVDGHGPATAYEAADVIKMLLIQARVQIVCIGLPHAETILDANDQLARRNRGRHTLEPLTFYGENQKSDMDQFLRALESALPFDRASGLCVGELPLLIYRASDGCIGRIMNLVRGACEVAIDDGLDRLTRQSLADSYEAIERVGSAENPFLMRNVTDANFAAVKENVASRRRRTIEAQHGGRKRGTQSPTAAVVARLSFKK